jgi:hypothetical protein
MSPVPSVLVLGSPGEAAFLTIDQVPITNSPIVINTIFLTITWSLVGLRAWTRGRILKSFGWDDLAMLFALVSYSLSRQILSTNSAPTVLHSLQHRMADDPFVYQWKEIFDKDRTGKVNWCKSHLLISINPLVLNEIQWLLVTEDFYVLTMICLKISLSLFFLRVLLQQWERRIIYVVVTLSTLFGIGYFFVAVFQCGIYKDAFDFWTKLISNQCITPPQVLGVSYTYAVITTLTDCTFAILPIPMLRKSQLALKEKFIVGFILILGAM